MPLPIDAAKTWTETLLLVAPTISAVVALFAFLFSVGNTSLSRRNESNRRDWERLQALAQILYKGGEVGTWAQRLAVRELAGLKTRKTEALLLVTEALSYWEMKPETQPALISELRRVKDNLSR